MKGIVLLALVACACPSKKPPQQGGAAGGSAAPASATTCDGIRPRVEQLYRAEAEAKEVGERVAEAVADNTQMVMNDCVKDPGRIVPCLAKATAVSELEKECLIPLDDEGTEAK